MQVNLAKTAGFCFGVDRAVNLVYDLLAKGKKVCTLGPIIHNQQLVDDLISKGVKIIDDVDSDKAKRALLDGNIVIFGGGTGKPFFSTDTGAALRAKDIGADIIIKLTNVDGVYDKDPNKYSDAVMYHTVSYKEVIDKNLGVMDMEAIEICRDNNIKIVVTNIDNVNALDDIIEDKNIGTVVYK